MVKSKFIRISLVIIFIFLLFNFAISEEKKDKAEEISIISVDDVINYQMLADPQISPDGKKVLWVQSRADKEKDKHLREVWMGSIEGEIEPIQLTRGDSSSWSPRWSPDGKRIAFLSDREKKTQIFVISPFGGESEKLTDVKMGVNNFRWKNNEEIIFSAREDETFHEKNLKEKKDDAEVVEDMEAFYPIRLFSIELKDKKVTRLTENKDRIENFEVSPDGKWAITSHVDTPLFRVEAKHRPKYFLLGLSDRSIKQILKEKYFSPSFYLWADDGKRVFLEEEKTNYEEKRGSGISLLYEYDPFSNRYQEIPLNWPNGLGGTYGKVFDTGGGMVVTTLAKGVINPFVIIKKPEGSKEWQIIKIDHPMASNFHTYSLSKDGKGIVFIHSTASEIPQLFYGKLDGSTIKDLKKITDVNKHLKNKFIAKREIIRWKSDKGREVEGILFYPKDYKEGEKYPLILNIHGGPAAYDPDHFTLSWGDYPHILAGKGSFVLFVNYSGSSNYGLEFVESIYGKYYELEVPDLLNGVKHLIKKGIVDPEKLGTMGWSNGAILSIALTVESDVFKVALCGAGDVNWVSDYGNCAFGPQFDNLYLKGPYWEDVDYYIKKSPLFKMNKVKTPTLILFGDKDTSVPTQQGWEHYRALQQFGKVPVKFVLFPGEPHGLMRISHQRRKMEEELEWLDKYLFKKEEKEIKSFKKGSPLDLVLKKSAIKKDEKGCYGIIQNGILIPETVKMGDEELGRFEVTRAQFFEFLKENKDIDTKNLVEFINGKFKAGTENYPVSGVNFDTAMKYCEWLSSKTGKKFRLPEEKEMKKWLETCKGEENTLCYWAGYDLSIDEAGELEKKFKELEESRGLIMEAGSMSPSTGEVYDLNGNVSEWCIKDGKESSDEKKSIVLGLSARNVSDKRQPFKAPPASYVGFRVVLVK